MLGKKQDEEDPITPKPPRPKGFSLPIDVFFLGLQVIGAITISVIIIALFWRELTNTNAVWLGGMTQSANAMARAGFASDIAYLELLIGNYSYLGGHASRHVGTILDSMVDPNDYDALHDLLWPLLPTYDLANSMHWGDYLSGDTHSVDRYSNVPWSEVFNDSSRTGIAETVFGVSYRVSNNTRCSKRCLYDVKGKKRYFYTYDNGTIIREFNARTYSASGRPSVQEWHGRERHIFYRTFLGAFATQYELGTISKYLQNYVQNTNVNSTKAYVMQLNGNMVAFSGNEPVYFKRTPGGNDEQKHVSNMTDDFIQTTWRYLTTNQVSLNKSGDDMYTVYGKYFVTHHYLTDQFDLQWFLVAGAFSEEYLREARVIEDELLRLQTITSRNVIIIAAAVAIGSMVTTFVVLQLAVRKPLAKMQLAMIKATYFDFSMLKPVENTESDGGQKTTVVGTSFLNEVQIIQIVFVDMLRKCAEAIKANRALLYAANSKPVSPRTHGQTDNGNGPLQTGQVVADKPVFLPLPPPRRGQKLSRISPVT
ncbi:hypothetical protein HK102_011291 [Quaeritorhiza haematococci]|nr:hypothetical protein HK102_011291 [Quaeritorhiza haematococci]